MRNNGYRHTGDTRCSILVWRILRLNPVSAEKIMRNGPVGLIAVSREKRDVRSALVDISGTLGIQSCSMVVVAATGVPPMTKPLKK